MVPFDRPAAPGIVDGNIERVFEASDGAVWVGSRGAGLSRISGTAITTLRQRDGLPRDLVRAFAEAADGTVWVATGGGVVRLARGSRRPEPASDGLPSPRVDALAVDAGGVVWAGTRAGLARWDPSARRWQPELGHPSVVAASVQALLPEPDGTLWVGTTGAGLLERRGPRWRVYTTEDGLGSNLVSALLRERGGRLWAATRNGGLAWRAGERFQRFDWPLARCDQGIEALAEDAAGGLWIGTVSCGLHRIQDRPIRAVARREGLPVDWILGVNGAGDGTIWIGTRGGGIARIAPGSHLAEPIPMACGNDRRACESCWDIAPGTDGTVWAVCGKSDLLRWNGREFARAPLPPGIDAADMVTVAGDGAVWIARGDRVVRWHQGVATGITGLETLTGRRIPYRGRGGTVWIAADDGVADWRDGRVARVVRFPAGEAAAEVSTLHEDAAGALWIGTRGAGLRLVRGGHAAAIGVAQGLPSDWIAQILEDDAGRLWLSSGRGLLSVARRDLEEVADGRRARISADVYDGTDGVLIRAGGFGHPAGWKDRQGRLWFATFAGVAVVDPAALRTRAAPAPPVVVQHLMIDGRRIEAAPPAVAVVGPGARDVAVVFAVPSLAAPGTISLRYRLEGRDADWVEAGSRRSAHYEQLAPGRYRLTAQARHRAGKWSESTGGLDLVVRPPFYRSIWFLLLSALALGLVLAAAHRIRVARTRAALVAVMAERGRIARDIHDTLAQAFVATSVRLQCLDQALERDDRATIRRHFEKAKSMVKESLEEARRAVWVLRPQALEHGLPTALEGLCRGASGDTAVDLEVSGAPRPLPPMVEANLLRIAQEAVANAYRHAHARRIVLRLSFAARAVVVSVIDDGTGLPTTGPDGQAPLERGLAGMRERAADIGGRFSVASRPGGGTAIEVEVAA